MPVVAGVLVCSKIHVKGEDFALYSGRGCTSTQAKYDLT